MTSKLPDEVLWRLSSNDPSAAVPPVKALTPFAARLGPRSALCPGRTFPRVTGSSACLRPSGATRSPLQPEAAPQRRALSAASGSAAAPSLAAARRPPERRPRSPPLEPCGHLGNGNQMPEGCGHLGNGNGSLERGRGAVRPPPLLCGQPFPRPRRAAELLPPFSWRPRLPRAAGPHRAAAAAPAGRAAGGSARSRFPLTTWCWPPAARCPASCRRCTCFSSTSYSQVSAWLGRRQAPPFPCLQPAQK